jgi:hypothetical protein
MGREDLLFLSVDCVLLEQKVSSLNTLCYSFFSNKSGEKMMGPLLTLLGISKKMCEDLK